MEIAAAFRCSFTGDKLRELSERKTDQSGDAVNRQLGSSAVELQLSTHRETLLANANQRRLSFARYIKATRLHAQTNTAERGVSASRSREANCSASDRQANGEFVELRQETKKVKRCLCSSQSRSLLASRTHTEAGRESMQLQAIALLMCSAFS